MRVVIFFIIGFLIINTVSCQTEWKKYNNPSHDFCIDFIQEPQFIVDTSLFQDSPQYTYNWTLSVDDTLHENKYYSISVTKYPSDFINYDSLLSVVEGFINSSQNSLIEDNTFTSLSSSLIVKNGYPGKSFKWKNVNTNLFLEYQVFLVNSTLYQLAVVSREGENHNIFIDKFFNSFDLLNVPNGKFVLPSVSEELNYIIKFPGKSKLENKFVDSEFGRLNINIQVLEQSQISDNLVYVATQTKYPTTVVNQGNNYELNNYYKKSIDGSLKSVNGELISIKDISYDGKLGKEFRCYYAKGANLMVYRLFYIDDYLYSFGVITTPDKDNNKAMVKFLDSFQIKK